MITKEQALKKYFGYTSFRPLQAEIIDNILAGNDSLVLMPTGGGKSVCFQIPALVNDGLCVVISPLIALMKDQVEGLKANGVAAAFLNSTVSASEQNKIEQACYDKQLKLLYLSPEKLFANNYIQILSRFPISLFAIDEAHCISFWGHDFRPEYTQLNKLKKHFPNIPIIALTATADRVTRKDILQQLSIEERNVFISSFDRPNLSLTVLPARGRIQYIIDFISTHRVQAGIVYCLSRKSTEELAEKLVKAGYKAKAYHAGMEAQQRSQTQEDFLKDDIQIICATIAFGMGIDKSNVRWVIHYNLPKNIESFYQEIGRAGRDGMPSETILFYNISDYFIQIDFLKDLAPERRELQTAKLDRMRQYAEADICRRRILISYFNETVEKDCGNCDVCLNPRSKFDATILAQKALSAVVRTDEKIAIGAAIEILRGSHVKSLVEKGYDKIKTFGAGKELRADEWADYLLQMLNSGVVDIAYDEGHALKLNPTSWQVLKEGKKVMLSKAQSPEQKKEQYLEQEYKKKSKKEVLSDDLFDRLKVLRKQLADSQSVPAYIIFNDKTLSEMATDMPLSEASMLEVSGVGQQKFEQYGQLFLNEILNFAKTAQNGGSKIKGATYLVTHDLYLQGNTPEQIAAERGMNIVTVFGHLCQLVENGTTDIDLRSMITESELAFINKALDILPPVDNALKPIFDYLGGEVDYHKIRIAYTLRLKS